ncbi:unnamed protein product [Durusdinium trenchii]|uniref:Uncharacterized protein n=1 Tax=Durusdinium trenchii TaxID=1381693 RepID=A0ABP0JHI0_9DINO
MGRSRQRQRWLRGSACLVALLWVGSPCWLRCRVRMSAVNAREPAGWKCVSGCGACCMLGTEDRPFLKELLSEEQLKTFRSLPREDGWCKHFDHESRTCKIYDDRPDFCRVKTFLCAQAPFFGVDSADEDALGGFCADSCRQNIGDVYGDDSEEMLKFDSEVSVFLDIENEDGEIPEMSPKKSHFLVEKPRAFFMMMEFHKAGKTWNGRSWSTTVRGRPSAEATEDD